MNAPSWLILPPTWTEQSRETAATRRAAAGRAWKMSLPEASFCFACTENYRRMSIWRIDGFNVPFNCPDFCEAIDTTCTENRDDGEVFARVRSGKNWLARLFVEVRLEHTAHVEQFAECLKSKEEADAT